MSRWIGHVKQEPICGIYYLWDGAEVLYVGKSINVQKRIARHRSARLDFSGYFVDTCAPLELDRREAQAIAEFSPKHNVNANLGA
jgi:excinuclease UvrABC nuclease subunit